MTDEFEQLTTYLKEFEGVSPSADLRARVLHQETTPLRVALECCYCHDALTASSAVHCAACLAPHHESCFREHQHCSAPGCVEVDVVRRGKLQTSPPRRYAVFVALGVLAAGIAALQVGSDSAPPQPPPVLTQSTPPRAEMTEPSGPGAGVARVSSWSMLFQPGDRAEVRMCACHAALGKALTVETWIRPERRTARRNLVELYEWGVWVGTENPPGESIPEDATPLEPFRWYHVACTYDGTTKRVFVDGELTVSVPFSCRFEPNQTVFKLGSAEFTGFVDEVRVWRVARTAEEIRTHMRRKLSGTEQGLLAYYPFDSPYYFGKKGPWIRNHSENGYDARRQGPGPDGGPTWSTIMPF